MKRDIPLKSAMASIILSAIICVTLVQAPVPLYAHDLQAHEDEALLAEKIKATQEKTILLADRMVGGIEWNKHTSIENAYARYLGSRITENLTDILVVDTNGDELHSFHVQDGGYGDLMTLVETHTSADDSATFHSFERDAHTITVVSVYNKKLEHIGNVAMAWRL